jgi:YegS/Rv2252/BmrU family lipid kinase
VLRPVEFDRTLLIMNEHWIAIVNPKSGSAGDDFRGVIETALQERGVAHEIRETTIERGGGILAQEAVEQGATHILACGGDGTVMECVNGVGKAKKEATLGIVPGGTANLLATALNIPRGDVDGAIGALVAGEDRVIDLGQCGEHLFALGLGLGLTERLVSQTSAKEKEVIGKWAYARAMMMELGARPHNFTLVLDGKKIRERGVALVVANAGEISGKLQFAPDAKMDDGVLDICVLRRFYFRDVLRMGWTTLFGDIRADRAVEFYQAKTTEILSDPPLDLQIDGEEVEQQTPLRVEVRPGALRVRVPIDTPLPDKEAKEANV